MIKQKKRAYHFETSSLLPLKLALIQAGKDSPPRAPKEGKDVNEELALRLIARINKERIVIARRVIFPTTAKRACGKQSPVKEEIASGKERPRNDIELEP